jgi:hypothetical protein
MLSLGASLRVVMMGEAEVDMLCRDDMEQFASCHAAASGAATLRAAHRQQSLSIHTPCPPRTLSHPKKNTHARRMGVLESAI